MPLIAVFDSWIPGADPHRPLCQTAPIKPLRIVHLIYCWSQASRSRTLCSN